MDGKEEFNLSDFICESLCVSANSTAPLKPMVHLAVDPCEQLYKLDPLTVLGEIDFKPAEEIPKNVIGTPIQEFFRGVNVFITGGTGFVGKLLTEKLLRVIPHIGNVYLLIRSKKGQNCEERFNSLLEDKIFSRMKAEIPHYLSKLKPLSGDIFEPNLGLSEEDQKLIHDTVHVVFHCAADVNFMKPLKHAINANVLGSQRVLNLAKSITGLKAYVHVSTAFSHCTSAVIEERVPKLSISYKEICDRVQAFNDTPSEEDLQNVMQGSPNSYIFSKAVCEDMVEEESKGLPVCIIRPTIVTATYKEPVRGYTDNLYGPIGMVLGTAVGVLHCMEVSEHHGTDGVPVDYLVNFIIAAAFNTGCTSDRESIKVYNFTSKAQNKLCWKHLTCFTAMLDVWPSSHSLWYTSFMFVNNPVIFNICHIFLHKIPGAIVDKLIAISGGTPRLGHIYKRIETLKKPLEFFQGKFWEFKDDNVTEIWHKLNEEDKKIFDFDVNAMNWMEYIVVSWLGMRYYFLKEDMDSIPASLKKRKWLHIAHVGLKMMFGVGMLKLAVCIAHVLPI